MSKMFNFCFHNDEQIRISLTNLMWSIRHDVIYGLPPGKSDEPKSLSEFRFWVFGHNAVNNFPKL